MSGLVRLTIKDINVRYAKFNLRCLSETYNGNKKLLIWQCIICENVFHQSKNGVDKDFIRCKKCFRTSQLDNAIKYAAQRGGICLSIEYKKSTDKLKFRCKYNHEFEMMYSAAVNIGHWCPICSKSANISEEICRAYFEAMFGEKFISIRPKWLNKNGYNLELDGYCEKLGIAFEHNGTFHYETERAIATQLNDRIKFNLCNINGVKLIIIEQLFNKTPFNQLRQSIIEKSNSLGIHVPFPLANVDLNSVYISKVGEAKKFYHDLATAKGGKMLSEYCGVANEKVLWECQLHHQWRQFPYVIKKGSWCPVCAGLYHSPNIVKW